MVADTRVQKLVKELIIITYLQETSSLLNVVEMGLHEMNLWRLVLEHAFSNLTRHQEQYSEFASRLNEVVRGHRESLLGDGEALLKRLKDILGKRLDAAPPRIQFNTSVVDVPTYPVVLIIDRMCAYPRISES